MRRSLLVEPLLLRSLAAGGAAALVVLAAAGARAEPLVLDRARVVALARELSPEAAVANARTAEARAQRTGAGAWAPTNPELSVLAGPRFYPAETKTDVLVSLQWPFDVSGAPSARASAAEAQVRVAEAEQGDSQRRRIAEALDRWLEAVAGEGRVALDSRRVELDAGLLHAARVQRDAGAAGDGDVALATVVAGEAAAQLHRSRGEREAALALLRARLGLAPEAPVLLQPGTGDDEQPTLESLLAKLAARPDLLRAARSVEAARAEADLQRRAGWPIPRVSVGAGQSPEKLLQAGVVVPLPVYQRNQTASAVAAAREQTAILEQRALLSRAGGELRAAWARFEAARAAARELESASPAVEDAEHLATRAYELGQGTLAGVLLARGEAARARLALLEGRIAQARALLALELAAGASPSGASPSGASP